MLLMKNQVFLYLRATVESIWHPSAVSEESLRMLCRSLTILWLRKEHWQKGVLFLRILRRCRIICEKRKTSQEMLLLLIMVANDVLGSTGHSKHMPWGLVLSAGVQCICRIPPEAEHDAEVHFSVHYCLAVPSAMHNLSGEMSRDLSTKALVPVNEHCWQFKLKLVFNKEF